MKHTPTHAAQSVCFTGRHSSPRKVLSAQAESAGFTFQNHVSADLTYLVISDDAKMTTKIHAAARLGTQILTESRWANLIQA